MSRYVRLTSVNRNIPDRIFDLADGSLQDRKPVGKIGDREVWSAEALLIAIEAYADPGELVFIQGMHIEDSRDPDPFPEEEE